jgi:hypothetical protein
LILKELKLIKIINKMNEEEDINIDVETIKSNKYIVIMDDGIFKSGLDFEKKIEFLNNNEYIDTIISPNKTLYGKKSTGFKKVNISELKSETKQQREIISYFKLINLNFNKHENGTFKIIFKKNITMDNVISIVKNILEDNSDIIPNIEKSYYNKHFGLFQLITFL